MKISVGASYRAGENVTVTVANGLDRTIYTEDFKTQCTIVILQRQTSGSWTDITGCKLGRPTLTVSLKPGESRTITLAPDSFHVTFGAGAFRIKFTYRMTAELGGDDPNVAYSTEFRVA